MTLALGEGVAFGSTPQGGSDLTADAVLLKADGIVARRGLFVGIFRAIALVVHIELPRGGHGEQGAQFRTAYAAECDMGEAGEVFVGVLVGCRPPAVVLVVGVQVAAHHIEGHDGHHAVRHYGSRIADAVVRGADEGIDVVHGLLGL